LKRFEKIIGTNFTWLKPGENERAASRLRRKLTTCATSLLIALFLATMPSLTLGLLTNAQNETPSPPAQPSPSALPSPSPSPTPPANLHQWGAVTLFHGLPSDRVHAIAQTPDGVMWFATDGGLAKYDGRRTQAVIADGLPPGRVLALKTNEDGALWIGTVADGLFRLKGNDLEKVPTSQQSVDCLSEDREGNIWAGTRGGGLNLIRPSAVQLIGRETGLPFEAVASVCEDLEGVIWVAGQSGTLSRFQNGKWDVIDTEAGWTGGAAACVAADRKGGVWVGSRS